MTDNNVSAPQREWQVADVLQRNGIGFTIDHKSYGTIYRLDRCLTSDAHQDGAAIIETLTGGLDFVCHHDSCRGRGWKDVRARLGLTDTVTPAESANPAPVAPPKTMNFRKIADIVREGVAEREWLWENVLPVGGLSLLGGKPKKGKSTLARSLAVAVARGEPFLDRPTRQCPVVYVALEEIEDDVVKHFVTMGVTDEDIHLHVGRAGNDPIAEIGERIRDTGSGLCVVDTVARLLRVSDFDDYALVSRAMESLIELSRDTGCHFVLNHHLGKAERRGADAYIGSTALYASVDVGLLLIERNGVRTLGTDGHQRYRAYLPEIVVLLDEVTEKVVAGDGNNAPRSSNDLDREIIETIGRKRLTNKEIAALGKWDESLVGKRTRALHQTGRLQRLGTGRRGGPYQYLNPSAILSQKDTQT